MSLDVEEAVNELVNDIASLVDRNQTTVVCLKGRRDEWGASLEKAPLDVVYIGRQFNMGGWKIPRSPWANDFSIAKCGDREEVIRRYRADLVERLKNPKERASFERLRGTTLACWCHPEACHGDVIVELLGK